MDQHSEADALITCLLRNAELRSRAVATAGALSLFDPVKHPGHGAVWDAVRKIHTFLEEDKIVPLFHLRTELTNKLGSSDKEELLNEAMVLVDMAEEVDPEEVVFEVGLRYFETFHVAAAKQDMMAKLTKAYSKEDLLKMVNNTASGLEAHTIGEDTVIESPLLDPVKFMPTSIKKPTGVRWIDQLSMGGHADNEVIGILGPTGGGKTLTATQLQMSQALRKQHALLVLYEQPLEGDVAERLYCQLFNDRDIDFFRNIPPKAWPKEDKKRYQQLSEQFGRYVHVLNFAKGKQGMNGVKDITDAVVALQEAGQPPNILIIDWLWPAVRRYCIAHNIGLDKTRMWASAFIDDLKCLTTRTPGMTTVLFHQLNTDMSRASPAKLPVVTDAYEMKDISYMLDACYVIGNRDRETNVMWLATDKNRRGAPQSILGKMNGARGYIEPAPNMVYDARAGFVPADDNKISDDGDIAAPPDDYS